MRSPLRAAIAFVAALLPSALLAQASSPSDTRQALQQLAKGEQISGLPPADSVSAGARSVPAGTTVKGTIVARGPIDVSGTVEGSVVSLGADVVVRRGGHVTGHALSVGGHVLADSGIVDGEIRTMSSLPSPVEPARALIDTRSAADRTVAAVKVVAG